MTQRRLLARKYYLRLCRALGLKPATNREAAPNELPLRYLHQRKPCSCPICSSNKYHRPDKKKEFDREVIDFVNAEFDDIDYEDFNYATYDDSWELEPGSTGEAQAL